MMKIEEAKKVYWCHSCRAEFTSQARPGKEDIECPCCHHNFCELMQTSSPKLF